MMDIRALLNKKIKKNKLSYSNVKRTYTIEKNSIVSAVVVTKGEGRPFNRYIKHNMALCCTRPPTLNACLIIFKEKLHTYGFFSSTRNLWLNYYLLTLNIKQETRWDNEEVASDEPYTQTDTCCPNTEIISENFYVPG